MEPQKIIDKKTFIEYVKFIDEKNLYKYIKLIEFYENNSMHNVYKISSYIFSKIHNRISSINNVFNYFSKSISENINKLNENLIQRKNDNLPNWLKFNLKSVEASQEEQEEMNKLLKEYK